MSSHIPMYRKHKNGQAFIKVKAINDGKPLYLGKFGSAKSKREYQRVLRLIFEQANSKLVGQSGVPQAQQFRGSETIVELILSYDDFARKYYSKDGEPTKEYMNLSVALRRLDLLLGDLPIDEFEPAHLELYQQRLIGESLCRNYVNKSTAFVKRFLRWVSKQRGMRAGLYGEMKCIGGLIQGRTDARESEKVEPVAWHVVQATLPWLNPVVAAMVQTQLLCGMRPEEVCAMTCGEIKEHGDIWLFCPDEHKNAWRGLNRFVPIPRVAQQIVGPFLQAAPGNPDGYLFSPAVAETQRLANLRAKRDPNRKTPVYPSELRAREKRRLERTVKQRKKPPRDFYDTDSYRNAIVYGLEKAERHGTKIEHWTPLQLRHTMATAISEKMDEQSAQRWLGHEHLETTKIYAKRQVSELVAIARELDRLMLMPSQ